MFQCVQCPGGKTERKSATFPPDLDNLALLLGGLAPIDWILLDYLLNQNRPWIQFLSLYETFHVDRCSGKSSTPEDEFCNFYAVKTSQRIKNVYCNFER